MSGPEEVDGGFWADPTLARGIVQTSPVGITIFDEAGRIGFANERAERILGRSRADLEGLAYDDRRWELVDEDGEPFPEGETPFEHVIETGESVDGRVVGVARPDGERIWLSINGAIQGDGDVERAIFAFEDVTERVERERERERAERRFEAVFEDPNILVGLLEPDGTVIDINGTAMEYIEADLADVTGEPFWETPWWGQGDGIQDDVREWTEQAADGEYVDFQANLTRPDGSAYTLSGYFRPVTDDQGDVVSIIVSDRDISERKRRERELEESERRYRALVEHFPNGAVTLVDEELRYQTVGGRPTDVAGVTADTIEGEPVREAVPAHLADELVPRYAAAFEGESGTFEIESNGRIYQFQVVPVRDDDGDVFAALGMSQDVTDRKRFEDAIHDLHETTRALFHADDEDTVAEQVVTAANDVLGLSDVALYRYDEPTDELYPVATAQEVGVMWDELPRVPVGDETIVGHVYATGESVRWDDIRESPHFIDAETEMRAGVYASVGDWGAIFAGSDAIGAFDERTSQLLELLAANADAAFDRVERARELEESERRYRTLVENFPNGSVGLFDENLEYVAAGGQLMDRLGMEPEDRIGRSIRELHPTEILDTIEPYFERALAGESDSFEIEYMDRNLLAHSLPVRDADDEVYAGMLVVQDVTEQREYERKLEASNERLEQFAYAASHDLQEPLRMVSSYLQLIEQRYAEDLDEDGQEFLEFAVDGANRMRDMIQGLLHYSRVDTRGDPFEPVGLEDVLADVRQDLRVKIEERNAEITTDELPVVYGDARQLNQVFQNLLVNAIEYSGDEPPRIHVSADRRGEEWIVSVADEGIGIDPGDADRVFEVFQSLHGHAEGGTGIGLALCERIVERHGGDIWVDSEPGEGATFSFTLPAVEDEAAKTE